MLRLLIGQYLSRVLLGKKKKSPKVIKSGSKKKIAKKSNRYRIGSKIAHHPITTSWPFSQSQGKAHLGKQDLKRAVITVNVTVKVICNDMNNRLGCNNCLYHMNGQIVGFIRLVNPQQPASLLSRSER